ncbi:MAG TPA: TRAP transporter substrate-binding protein DctP [Acidimicrobiia bacterium]|nr:TRAP transporter substrate-binding protein DctP [Acidimicrobiia bacterium]
MSRPTRRLVSTAFLTVALVVSACGTASEITVDDDRAGGAGLADPTVLRMAQPNDGAPPPQLVNWAEEVTRRSDGSLEIEFVSPWRHGEADYEAGTIEDVMEGKIDLAWVGARAFDTVGINNFQALVAPMLIDNYDLQGAVFEAGVPERMLTGLTTVDLVGIGVLPGPMRRVLGVSKPFLRPTDFENMVVGIQASGVAAASLSALGATPEAVPSGASLDGLDGYEQQLSSIAGNHYGSSAGYVTGNLNLWPRPLVIFANPEVFASLTDTQQAALRDSAAAAAPGALLESRAEDDAAVAAICEEGMILAVASEADLAAMRAAFEPVYTDLEIEPGTRTHLRAIASLKQEFASPVESSTCPGTATASDTSTTGQVGALIPDGRYQATLTTDDWAGVDGGTVGVFTMIFASGELTILDPYEEVGFAASYTVFRDRIEATDNVDTVNARWEFDGEELTFSDVEPSDSPFAVVWGSHPWALVDGG